MTPREQSAFNAGIEAMRQMALIAAVTLETREGGDDLRHQAAAAALQGLAEGADALMIGLEPGPMRRVFEAITLAEGDSGTVECPDCKGRLRWGRDSLNGHLHGQCETEGCLRWMQ